MMIATNTSFSTLLHQGFNTLSHWGSYPVRWIRDRCQAPWWKQIQQREEIKELKRNWIALVPAETREQRANQLRHLYEQIDTYKNGQAPLGKVYWIPGEFNLWMPGMALVASYLAEKKKVKGLFVCNSLETLSMQIQKMHANPTNQRCAFIVATFQSGSKVMYPGSFEPNFPQHKVAICVEKREGRLHIAMMDALPINGLHVRPNNLTDELWEGYEEWDKFNGQELVFRAILQGCRRAKCPADLYYSNVLREKKYGCEVYALQDAISYLRDPAFFNRISNAKATVVIDDHYSIKSIDMLPPEYMIGTQSVKALNHYKEKVGQQVFDQSFPKRKKTLQKYLDKYLVVTLTQQEEPKVQNHYLTKKSFEYLTFALVSLKVLKADEIRRIINKTLLSQDHARASV